MPGAGIGAHQAKLDYSKRGKNEMAVLNMATFLEYKTVGNVPFWYKDHMVYGFQNGLMVGCEEPIKAGVI